MIEDVVKVATLDAKGSVNEFPVDLAVPAVTGDVV